MADYTSLYTGAQIDKVIASGSTTTGNISGSYAGTGSIGKLFVAQHITASGNATITGNVSGSNTTTGSFGAVTIGTTKLGSADVLVVEGRISGSGNLKLAGANAENSITVQNHITSSGVISGSGNLISDWTGNHQGLLKTEKIGLGRSVAGASSTGAKIYHYANVDNYLQFEPASDVIQVSGDISSSYASDNALGIIGTHRIKTFGTHADGQTVHLSASGGTILQSTDGAVITLPATKLGLKYTFIHAGAATEQFDLSPNASDKIMGSCADSNAMGTIVEAASNGAGADNKDLQLDNGSGVGDRVTIVADGASGWYITECVGSWAFES